MALVPCPSCNTHLVEGSACPHCGASRRVGLARTTSVMLLLGLSLGADCGNEQPLYGAAMTTDETTGETGDTGDTDRP